MFAGMSPFFRRMIIPYKGSIASIPTGWVFCNGSNGTPDLRDRFIVCAKQDDGGVAKSNVDGGLKASGGAADQPPKTGDNPDDVSNVTVTGAEDVAGPSHGHDFVPPFYALAYIMKT